MSFSSNGIIYTKLLLKKLDIDKMIYTSDTADLKLKKITGELNPNQ